MGARGKVLSSACNGRVTSRFVLTLACWLLVLCSVQAFVVVAERSASSAGWWGISVVWNCSCTVHRAAPGRKESAVLLYCCHWSMLLLWRVLILWCWTITKLGPNCQVHLQSHQTLQAFNYGYKCWFLLGMGRWKKWMKYPGSLFQYHSIIMLSFIYSEL